jgi:hypothetical protein
MAKTKDGFYKQFNSQTGLNSNILLAGGGMNPLTASNENLGCVKVASVSSDVSNADTTITDNKYALHLDRYGLAYVAIPSDTKVSYESNSSNLYHPILFANNTSSTGDPSPGSVCYESNTTNGNGLTYNPSLNIIGILITMFTPRFKLSKEVLSELESYYFGLIFDQKVSRSIVASEASSFAEPLYYYSKYSKSSLEYMSVSKEIITKAEGLFL